MKAKCNNQHFSEFDCSRLMISLQTPIPCNEWSLLEYPHLRLQVPLAHTLLQCKIHCEEIKKDRWKCCSIRVTWRKSHAMHLSRQWRMNDGRCHSLWTLRNATDLGSNGMIKEKQILCFYSQHTMELFNFARDHSLFRAVDDVFVKGYFGWSLSSSNPVCSYAPVTIDFQSENQKCIFYSEHFQFSIDVNIFVCFWQNRTGPCLIHLIFPCRRELFQLFPALNHAIVQRPEQQT